MKKVHPELFNEMKRTSSKIVAGWLLTRRDGVKFGFTSHDQPFTLDGIEYKPTNSFSGSASVSRNNLSVDNMTVLALMGDEITDADLRGGVYENAKVELFWCRPDKPEWGRMDIQGGTIGEIKIKNLDYEAELRSVSQKLQQPFGRVYTTECDTQFGSPRCGVNVDAPVWAPNSTYAATIAGDALIGAIVRPSVYNGFWYECVTAPTPVSTETPFNSLPLGLRNYFTGKSGPFELIAQLFAQELLGSVGVGGIVADPVLNIVYGNSGTTEPTWPTTLGQTVVDGQVTWKAILAREMQGTVSSTFNRARFEARDLAWVDDRYFQYGVVTWTSGLNEGFRMEVRQHRKGTGANFDLLEAMPFAIEPGDTFTVSPGCAKTRPACKGWNNIANFQGFPDMPTEDKALATPNYSSQGQQDSGGGKK